MTLELTAAPARALPLTVVASWDGNEPYLVDWGDGTEREHRRPGAMHHYAAPGAYTVSLIDSDGTVAASASMFVRPESGPQVTFTPADDNPNIVDAVWADKPAELVSVYDVHWGDAESQLGVIAGPGHAIAHGYRAGTYTARVRDRNAKRWGAYTFTVTDPVYDPEFELRQGADRYTAIVKVTRVESPGKEVLIDWGDGLQDRLPNAQVGSEVTHAYDFDDAYIVQCLYSDGSTDGSADTVTIPWPAPRGPKPTSEVIWTADAIEATGVWLRWVGSGWHYTIHWGDGATDRVTSWSKSIKHVYAEPGTYTVVCVSDLHQEWTGAAEVTVRDSTAVDASFALVEPGSNQVRATLARVDDPVRYQVDWGDNIVTEHDANDLAPVHEYPWNMPAPKITVRDVPAKRIGRFTGPDIGPGPEPPPGDRPVWWWTDRGINGDYDQTTVHVSGLAPGAPWTVYESSIGSYIAGRGTVGADGTMSCDVELWHGGDSFPRNWSGVTVRVLNTGNVAQHVHVPYHTRWQQGTIYPTYDWDARRPGWVELNILMPSKGTYRVDWGDGGAAETFASDGLSARAEHTYTDPGARRTLTITAPNGTNETLVIGKGTNEFYNWNGRDWLDFMYGSGGQPYFHHWHYVPAKQDWGDGVGPVLCAPVSSRYNDGSKKTVVGRIYHKTMDGNTVTATSYAPWTAPVSRTVTIKKNAVVRLDRQDAWIKTVSGEGFGPGEELRVRFQASRLGYWADGDQHAYLNETTVTAGQDGSFTTRPYRYLGDGPWRAGGVQRSDGSTYYVSTPWQSREELLLTYDFPAENGCVIVPQVDPIVPGGEYRIDWGDGAPVEAVTADDMGLDVWHQYQDAGGPYTMTVTDPEGRSASRLIYRPELDVRPSLYTKNRINIEQFGVVGGEYFCPVKVDWHDGEFDVWAQHLRSHNSSTILSNGYAAGQATVRAAVPLAAEPLVWTFQIPEVKSAQLGPQMRDSDQADVSGWWRLITPYEGGRTGEIRMRNTTGTPVRRWAASFHLPEGASVANVWLNVEGDVGVARIGPERWEVQALSAVDVEKQGVIGVEIDHPGMNEVKPDTVVATTWKAAAAAEPAQE